MKKKLMYLAALATFGFILMGGEVRQSPPQPDCAGFPELCSDSVAK